MKFGFLFSLVLTLSIFSLHCIAIDWNVVSLRTTLSRPDTSQSLIYRSPSASGEKTLFHLSPTNNERLGFFLDINDIEIGYAVDVVRDEVETDTQNFIVAYRKFENARIAFNYQTLEGLQTRVESLSGNGVQSEFLTESKSTKIELFGQHSLYTFGKKKSTFEHFFLNRPKLSDSFDWSLSVNAGWSVKRLSLESPTSILSEVDFIDIPPAPITKLDSLSASGDIGPFVSFQAPNNFHFFAEYKLGRGVVKNLSDIDNLKESGKEKARAIGAGASWTSHDEKLLVLLRGWKQEGRHVETSFGDLSMVWFF